MPSTRALSVRPPREKPVFVDRSGRRRRLSRLVGTGLAGLLVVTIGGLVAAVSGASSSGPPGLPGAGYHTSPSPTPPAPADTTPASDPGTEAGSTRPAGASPTATPSPTPTKPGRGPNQTPSHPVPSKSR